MTLLQNQMVEVDREVVMKWLNLSKQMLRSQNTLLLGGDIYLIPTLSVFVTLSCHLPDIMSIRYAPELPNFI